MCIRDRAREPRFLLSYGGLPTGAFGWSRHIGGFRCALPGGHGCVHAGEEGLRSSSISNAGPRPSYGRSVDKRGSVAATHLSGGMANARGSPRSARVLHGEAHGLGGGQGDGRRLSTVFRRLRHHGRVPNGRFLRDSRPGTIVAGTSEIMREILSRMIFEGHTPSPARERSCLLYTSEAA